jgi:orotidine-5'-phosphate decarboxylase
MTKEELYQQIVEKKSYLCVGLDTDIQRIPKHLLKADDPIYEFNCRIIDATHDLCVAYKPNIAFYEAQGSKGWKSLEKTINYIPLTHFTIADAKRGDIGNTSSLYARAFFEKMDTTGHVKKDAMCDALKREFKLHVSLYLSELDALPSPVAKFSVQYV